MTMLELRARLMVERYGPLIGIEELAEIFKSERSTIDKRIRAGSFPVATRREGGKRVADTIDVARYLDQAAREATGACIVAAGASPGAQ